MADFYQTGVVATLHRLGKTNIERLESELMKFSRARPIALILPVTSTELESEALEKIISNLKEVKYLKQIVVTMGRTNDKQFDKARKLFSVLPQETKIIWNTGKRIQDLYAMLEENELPIGDDGKGRSAWMAYGYVLAGEKSKVIALHDCDIVSYNKELLARLCYPTASTNLNYEFCKGFYSRVTDKMHGRVTRLFVTPLIRSLEKILGYLPLLVYMDSFRYPLAGEFSMRADLARVNRIPGDWGLEVGVLAEVFRNCSIKSVCQVEICENYEHKHQPLSSDNPKTGLMKMSIDIAKSIFRTLMVEGIVFSDGFFKTLTATYLRTSQDMLKRFHDDADINGLSFDRHEEGVAVETFTSGLKIAGEEFYEDFFAKPLIPNWNRITSAIPGFLDMLKEAVSLDNG